MPGERLVAIQALLPIVDQLRRCGADADAFVRGLGLDPTTLHDRSARVLLSALSGAAERAAIVSGDPYFGLHAGEHVDERSFDLLSYAAASSSTLEEALRTTARYFRLVTDVRTFELTLEGDAAVYATRVDIPSSPGTGRHGAEMVIALNHAIPRRLVEGPWALREVRFTHPAPRDRAEHARVFAAPVRFGAPHDAMVFDASLLRCSLRTSDPRLASILRGVAEDALARLPEVPSLSAAVRSRIPALLAAGDAGLERTARALATSPRTLQRRLREEGTSHQQLLDEVRRHLAERYLVRPELGVLDVALLLGFAETASFHRAFKRWTGKTPSAYRAPG